MNIVLRLPLLLALLASLSMMGCATTAQQTKEPAKSGVGAFDQALVLDILQESAVSWSRGDLDTFVSIYANDCLFMTPAGLTRGRADVLERYKQRYPDSAAMGKLTLEIVESRPAPPDGIAVAARWVLSYPDRPAASGHTLIIFRRIDGVWQIVQDASM